VKLPGANELSPTPLIAADNENVIADDSRPARSTASTNEASEVKASDASPQTTSPGDWLAGLWQKHSAGLLLYARQKSPAAEDLVQTAFLSLARQAEPPLDPATWLYRVVRNGAVSHWRQEQRRQRREQALAGERGEWFHPAQDAALDQAELREALTKLDPSERELVVLHVWGELTFAQLAEVLETSSSTAQRQYAAALVQLKKILGGDEL
jgi:RNA polymerase sigma factor (sigma-70 family)